MFDVSVQLCEVSELEMANEVVWVGLVGRMPGMVDKYTTHTM